MFPLAPGVLAGCPAAGIPRSPAQLPWAGGEGEGEMPAVQPSDFRRGLVGLRVGSAKLSQWQTFPEPKVRGRTSHVSRTGYLLFF